MNAGRSVASIIIAVIAVLASCKKDDVIVYESHFPATEKTIAIVAPLSNDVTKSRLETTVEWFTENFKQAQIETGIFIRLKYEWYDEDSQELTTLSKTLAARPDVIAIIGPFGNEKVAEFAPACQKTQKPLIVPTATSEDVIRRFAVGRAGVKNKKPFLWSLTETDVAFCEVMMSLYAAMKQQSAAGTVPSAALFAPGNIYGQTFRDWAPYQAENMNVNLVYNESYADDDELLRKMRNYLNTYDNISDQQNLGSFCVIENINQLYKIASLRRQWIQESHLIDNIPEPSYKDVYYYDNYWQYYEEIFRTWFAYNNLNEDDITSYDTEGINMLEGYQGFSPYADPATGFELSYESRYYTKPLLAECKLYDALMLAAFTCYYLEDKKLKGEEPRGSSSDSIIAKNEAFNDAIIAITNDVRDDAAILRGTAWTATTMKVYLSYMRRGILLKFRGASGDIEFDQDTYTVATHSTYVHWRIMGGRIEHLSYFGPDGKNRVSQSTAAWRLLYDEQRAQSDFAEQAEDVASHIVYPPMSDQYAVLVQGSSGFKNYRHQADVLNMYQLLRKNGYDDDHIILILDRSLANSAENNEKGVIRSHTDGPDLLGGTTRDVPRAAIDYDNTQLLATDIVDILLGNKTTKLPKVLPTTETGNARPNILFYWSGHGENLANSGVDEFRWLDKPIGEGFTATMMQQTANKMSKNKHYRKMLVVVEPCYGERVIRLLTGIPGVLGMSGASANEQSFADNWNGNLGPYGTWMSDCFSSNFVNYLTTSPETTYRDLYLFCVQHTLGSHVKIVNAANFGNLYATGPQEFINYNH